MSTTDFLRDKDAVSVLKVSSVQEVADLKGMFADDQWLYYVVEDRLKPKPIASAVDIIRFSHWKIQNVVLSQSSEYVDEENRVILTLKEDVEFFSYPLAFLYADTYKRRSVMVSANNLFLGSDRLDQLFDSERA